MSLWQSWSTSDKSLTVRQREILQQYTDDVEGQTSDNGELRTPHGVVEEPRERAGRRTNVTCKG